MHAINCLQQIFVEAPAAVTGNAQKQFIIAVVTASASAQS